MQKKIEDIQNDEETFTINYNNNTQYNEFLFFCVISYENISQKIIPTEQLKQKYLEICI